MTIPYSAGTSFATPTCVGGVIKYPFANEGDSATKVYVHDMQVARANYAPLAFNNFMETGGGANQQKPVRSPFPDDANAFWVGDSEPTDNGTSIVSFQRTFANVPVTRLEGNGIYAFTYPGTDSASLFVFDTSTGGESATYLNSNGKFAVMKFNVSDASIYQVGQRFDVRNDAAGALNDYQFEALYQFPGSTAQWYPFIVEGAFVTAIIGNQIEIRHRFNSGTSEAYIINFRSGVTITTFSMIQSLPIRSSFTQNGNSRKAYNYTKSDDLIGIPITRKFSVVDSSGTPTDTLSSTTIPTTDDYLDLKTNGFYIDAESSKISRWMGNIWEIVDITVETL